MDINSLLSAKNAEVVAHPLISNFQTNAVGAGSFDFKTFFHRIYLLNKDIQQGIVKIAQGETSTLTIHGVGEIDPTNAMGQFVLTTTLSNFENMVGAVTNLMEAQRKIEDYLQKIV